MEDIKQAMQLICDYVPDSVASVYSQYLIKVGLVVVVEGNAETASNNLEDITIKRKSWETDLEVFP